ncbi:hypothetical protein AIT66_04350 [Salmonella enterica subsp. salamae]|uniref:Teneurin-like YD-shell domain-containing protein n=1 Tax=Salmonella enterica subsp. salamae TaxID=59202 RepID=A0A8E6IIV7_SALER|nr:hypothetical protein AIT66_04350 [Salmonella enterica subsp. salamae]
MACRICCDQHRLALALVKPHGNIVWRAGYSEWGNVLWEENPESLAQLIRLPGQQYDEETGLYYNRHHYYDALLGRYITQDPIDTVRFTGRMKATEDESIGQALKPKGCHHLIRSHPVINRGSCSDTGCMIKI